MSNIVYAFLHVINAALWIVVGVMIYARLSAVEAMMI